MLVRAPLRKLPTWAEIRSIPLNAGYGPLWVQVTALSGHCHLSVYALSCMAREGRLSHSHRLSIDQGEAWVCGTALPGLPPWLAWAAETWHSHPQPCSDDRASANTQDARPQIGCFPMEWQLPHSTHHTRLPAGRGHTATRGRYGGTLLLAVSFSGYLGIHHANPPSHRLQTGVQLSRSGGCAKGGPVRLLDKSDVGYGNHRQPFKA